MEKLEARATLANDKLLGLAERIKALENTLAVATTSSANSNDDVSEPLNDYQLGMLAQLRVLRKQMHNDGETKKSGKPEDDTKINYRIKYVLEQLADAESDSLN